MKLKLEKLSDFIIKFVTHPNYNSIGWWLVAISVAILLCTTLYIFRKQLKILLIITGKFIKYTLIALLFCLKYLLIVIVTIGAIIYFLCNKLSRQCLRIILKIKIKFKLLKLHRIKQEKYHQHPKAKTSYKYKLFRLQNKLSNLGNEFVYNLKNYIADLVFFIDQIKKEYLEDDVLTSIANKRLNENFLDKLMEKHSEIQNLRRKERYEWILERTKKQKEEQEKLLQKSLKNK